MTCFASWGVSAIKKLHFGLCVCVECVHTHTDCTQTHTYFYRLSFSPLKYGRKPTHTWSENHYFFGWGLPQQQIFSPFLGTPGALNTVKNDTFGTSGALSQKTHTHLCPGGVLAMKKWPVLLPGAFQPLKSRLFCPLGRFSH